MTTPEERARYVFKRLRQEGCMVRVVGDELEIRGRPSLETMNLASMCAAALINLLASDPNLAAAGQQMPPPHMIHPDAVSRALRRLMDLAQRGNPEIDPIPLPNAKRKHLYDLIQQPYPGDLNA